MSDEDVQVPEAGVIERERDAVPADDDDQEKLEREYLDVPLEADEADVAEQSVEVDPDEDDEYR